MTPSPAPDGDGEDRGASPSGDRATHEQSPQAVSAVPVGIASAVPRSEWYWCGYPGHLIVADQCRFHLHTRIGSVIVSTVGDYRPSHKNGERDIIGCDRCFETYVFVARDTERPEGEPLTYGEIDSEGSNDSEQSERQHYAMCERWASAEMQAQAIEARRAETGTGSVHESAVPQGCAQPEQNP